jgi:hypothetical protein
MRRVWWYAVCGWWYARVVRGGDVRIPRNFRDFLDFGESRGSLYFFRT